MPQVRILSPRCDQKPDPNWYLSRPARGGFLLLTGTCAKAVPKSFHRFRWFGTTSPSVVDRDQHLQETWPEQSRNLRYTDPPSSCLHGSGFKTTRRLGTPLRSRRACRCLISGGDGKRLGTPHPDSRRREWHSPAGGGQDPAGFAVLTYQWTSPKSGCMSHRLPTCWRSNKAPFAQCVVTADLKPARTGFMPLEKLAVQSLTTCQPSGKHWLNAQFRWCSWKPSVVPLSGRKNRIPLRPSAMPRL